MVYVLQTNSQKLANIFTQPPATSGAGRCPKSWIRRRVLHLWSAARWVVQRWSRGRRWRRSVRLSGTSRRVPNRRGLPREPGTSPQLLVPPFHRDFCRTRPIFFRDLGKPQAGTAPTECSLRAWARRATWTGSPKTSTGPPPPSTTTGRFPHTQWKTRNMLITLLNIFKYI